MLVIKPAADSKADRYRFEAFQGQTVLGACSFHAEGQTVFVDEITLAEPDSSLADGLIRAGLSLALDRGMTVAVFTDAVAETAAQLHFHGTMELAQLFTHCCG